MTATKDRVWLAAALPTLALILMIFVPPAHAGMIYSAGEVVSLTDLIGGDEIRVGDKRFHNFVYSPVPGSDMPSADQVAVVGFFDDTIDGFGLQFSGAFRDLPGGGPSDAGLGFTVEVVESQNLISDAHLFGTLEIVGDTGEVSITEGFPGLPAGVPNLRIGDIRVDGQQGPMNQSDWLYFSDYLPVAGVQRLRVVKDIFAEAGEGTFDRARITTFTQTFTQMPIPEPSSLTILTTIGICCAWRLRRRSTGRRYPPV